MLTAPSENAVQFCNLMCSLSVANLTVCDKSKKGQGHEKHSVEQEFDECRDSMGQHRPQSIWELKQPSSRLSLDL